MNNSLEDYQIKGLLEALTWENWFFQLRVIHDRFIEIRDNDKADRCMDLISEGKRPYVAVDYESSDYHTKYMWRYGHGERCLTSATVKMVDSINRNFKTNNIQPQLTGYLQIPEKLRIPRTQVNNP